MCVIFAYHRAMGCISHENIDAIRIFVESMVSAKGDLYASMFLLIKTCNSHLIRLNEFIF